MPRKNSTALKSAASKKPRFKNPKIAENPKFSVPVPDNLTERQRVFCEEYVLNGGIGTLAIRAARYDCSTSEVVRSQAWENLTKPHLLAYIADLRKAVKQNFAVTAEEVISTFREIRRRGMQEEEIVDAKGNRTGMFKSDLFNANKANEMLGKTQGMFLDRQEITLDLEGIADKLSGELDFMDGRT